MIARKTLLLIGLAPHTQQALSEQFCVNNDFTIEYAPSVATIKDLRLRLQIDLILIDADSLPAAELDGLESHMEAARLNAPLIMLSGEADAAAMRDLEARQVGLVIKKPFRFSALFRKVWSLLQEFENSEAASFKLGPYQFQSSAKLLIDPDGRRIRLTEKETSILVYLYRSPEQVVAREELLRQVWGYNAAVTTHTLETHIYRLRQKIERDPADAKLLITGGGGYRLVA